MSGRDLVTVKRLLALLSLALALRRNRRRVERGLRIVKRGLLVVAVAGGIVAAVVWNRRKRAQAEEVPTGSKPIEGVGTATPWQRDAPSAEEETGT